MIFNDACALFFMFYYVAIAIVSKSIDISVQSTKFGPFPYIGKRKAFGGVPQNGNITLFEEEARKHIR